jgi:hypothetical protein
LPASSRTPWSLTFQDNVPLDISPSQLQCSKLSSTVQAVRDESSHADAKASLSKIELPESRRGSPSKSLRASAKRYVSATAAVKRAKKSETAAKEDTKRPCSAKKSPKSKTTKNLVPDEEASIPASSLLRRMQRHQQRAMSSTSTTSNQTEPID